MTAARTPRRHGHNWLFALLPILLLGVLPLVFGIRNVRQYVDTRPSSYVPQGWILTSGKIVRNHVGYGRIAYNVPVVRFVDDHGTAHVFTAAREYATYGASRVGQVVKVAYVPGDPAKAEFVNEPASVRVPSLMGGIFLLILATVVFSVTIGSLARSAWRRLTNS